MANNTNDFAEQMRQIAEQVYAEKGTRFNVADVPTHTHDDVNSVSLPFTSTVPNTGSGVLSATTLQLEKAVRSGGSTFKPASTITVPVPIIYGFNSAGTYPVAITFTGAVSSGATSATLTGNWAGTSGVFALQFGTFQGGGEVRYALMTNGSTAVTWPTALVSSYGTGASVVGNSAFNGGDAAPGTLIAFVNDDSTGAELWLKIDATNANSKATWFGVSLTKSVG